MASHNEDEYFAKEDVEKLRKLHKEQMRGIAPAQREEMKKLHASRCPNCGMEMKALPEYQGIKLLRCFECNGVFLEHTDLGKLKKHHESKDHKVVEAILNWFRQEP
jgi:protein-arginine kinase activator protein McsA